MFKYMIKHILIILLLLFVAYIIIYYCQKSQEINKNKNKNKKSIIHSSKMNRSFFIIGYDDNKISDIQLSLNKRNNVYTIKDNNLYFNGKLFDKLYNVC